MEEYIKDGSNYKPNVGVMNDFLNYYFKSKTTMLYLASTILWSNMELKRM